MSNGPSQPPDSILGFITGPSRVKNEVGNRYGRLISCHVKFDRRDVVAA